MALPPPYEQPPLYDGLATPETKTRLMQEVEAHADSALKVNEAFERIRVALGKIDEKNYKGKDGRPVDKFQETWIGYQKRWNDCLWDSRYVATSTEAYISDFLETIIPQVEAVQTNDDLADARADLAAFIGRTDPFKLNTGQTVDGAHSGCQRFDDLRRDVGTFKDKFDSFAQSISGGDLDQAIEKCTAWIKGLSIALVATVAIGVVGVFGLWYFGATTLIPWAVGGCALITAGEVAALIIKESQKRHLNDLKAIEEDMSHVKDSLKNFSTIWATVIHDAQIINAGLSAAVGDQGSMRAFKNRVERVRDKYTTLNEALCLYATKVYR